MKTAYFTGCARAVCHWVLVLLVATLSAPARSETTLRTSSVSPSVNAASPQVVAASPAANTGESWLLIDATTATLSVMRGSAVVKRFDDVAFGRLGTKPVHYLGDTSTPLGEMRINGISNSAFTLFFSLDYPTSQHTKMALDAGKITREQYLSIFNAGLEGRKPPNSTPLGGDIGIHGLGSAPLSIHRQYNWTRGCVALDNQQIRALAAYVRVGMRVVIK